VPGPNDDVSRIIRQLDRAVGDAFTFCMPSLGDLLESDDPWLDDEDEDEDDEEEGGELGDREDDTLPEGR